MLFSVDYVCWFCLCVWMWMFFILYVFVFFFACTYIYHLSRLTKNGGKGVNDKIETQVHEDTSSQEILAKANISIYMLRLKQYNCGDSFKHIEYGYKFYLVEMRCIFLAIAIQNSFLHSLKRFSISIFFL